MLGNIFGCYNYGHPVGSSKVKFSCPSVTTKRFLFSKSLVVRPPGRRRGRIMKASVVLQLLGRDNAVGKQLRLKSMCS